MCHAHVSRVSSACKRLLALHECYVVSPVRNSVTSIVIFQPMNIIAIPATGAFLLKFMICLMALKMNNVTVCKYSEPCL